jgi:hypothetical protein
MTKNNFCTSDTRITSPFLSVQSLQSGKHPLQFFHDTVKKIPFSFFDVQDYICYYKHFWLSLAYTGELKCAFGTFLIPVKHSISAVDGYRVVQA